MTPHTLTDSTIDVQVWHAYRQRRQRCGDHRTPDQRQSDNSHREYRRTMTMLSPDYRCYWQQAAVLPILTAANWIASAYKW